MSASNRRRFHQNLLLSFFYPDSLCGPPGWFWGGFDKKCPIKAFSTPAMPRVRCLVITRFGRLRSVLTLRCEIWLSTFATGSKYLFATFVFIDRGLAAKAIRGLLRLFVTNGQLKYWWPMANQTIGGQFPIKLLVANMTNQTVGGQYDQSNYWWPMAN